MYDLAHGLANNIADYFNCMLNKKDMAFTKYRRSFEYNTLLRFEGYGARERMPWMCDPVALHQLVEVERRRVLKVPIDWVPMFDISDGIPGKVCTYI